MVSCGDKEPSFRHRGKSQVFSTLECFPNPLPFEHLRTYSKAPSFVTDINDLCCLCFSQLFLLELSVLLVFQVNNYWLCWFSLSCPWFLPHRCPRFLIFFSCAPCSSSLLGSLIYSLKSSSNLWLFLLRTSTGTSLYSWHIFLYPSQFLIFSWFPTQYLWDPDVSSKSIG